MNTNGKINIRALEAADIAAAKALWLACFTEDDSAFVDYYFRFRTAPERMLGLFVYENERECGAEKGLERLVSMLCFEELSMRVSKEKTARIAYVAGVCTLNEYRHRGYIRRLLSELEKRLVEKGFDALLLRPFNFAFYERLGFRAFAKRRVCDLRGEALRRFIAESAAFEEAEEFELDAASMLRIYSVYTEGISGSLMRNEAKCAAILEEFSLDGANSIAVRTALGEAYALWWSAEADEDESPDRAELEEFAFTDASSANALIAFLLKAFGSVRIPLPVCVDFLEKMGEIEPFNMLKPIGGRRFEELCGGGEPFDFQKY